MGWGGATEIFDGVVDVALDLLEAVNVDIGADDTIKFVVNRMYVDILWDDLDTQDESDYFDPYLRDVMIELGEIDPADLT